MTPEEPNREQNPNAYTAPAENGGFQYTSCLEPASRAAVPRAKKRGAGPVIAAVFILLLLFSAFCGIFLHLSLSVRRDEHGFSVELVRRGRSEDFLHVETALPEEAPETRPLPPQNGGYEWSGASMRVSAAAREETMSYGQIYSACAPSIGILEAADGSGRTRRGTVIVMTEDGALVASTHLVSGAEQLRVTLGGEEYEAYVIGLDYATDLAVLKIPAENLESAVFCGEGSLAPGDPIAVVGDPVSGAISIRDGILSAVNPGFLYRGYPLEALQIGFSLGDVASGSALVNASGQIIGILNADLSCGLAGAEGVSLAISMNSARPVIDELLQNGCVAGRPSSGLTVSELPAAYAAYYEYPSCLYVASVDPDSTAAEAGMKRGDLILAANGVTVETVNDLYAVINGLRAGDLLTLSISRDRETKEVSYALMEAFQRKG